MKNKPFHKICLYNKLSCNKDTCINKFENYFYQYSKLKNINLIIKLKSAYSISQNNFLNILALNKDV